MTDAALIHLTLALRLMVSVAWTIIGIIGSYAMWRVTFRRSQKGDLGWASLFLLAIGLLIFQWRALSGAVTITPDPFNAIALFSLLLSAFGIFYARGLRAGPEHQRGALLAHLAMLAVLLGIGCLS